MVEYHSDTLDRVFAAVADPTRRAILASLARRPATVSEIAKPFAVSLNAVSKHLMVLERAGLMRREVLGREHHCALEPKPLQQATAWLEHYRHFWEVRLDALERYLLARKKQPSRNLSLNPKPGEPHATRNTGKPRHASDSQADPRLARGGIRRLDRSGKHPPLDVPGGYPLRRGAARPPRRRLVSDPHEGKEPGL